MNSTDVLILSVEAGAGHKRAAQALALALRKKGLQSQTEDLFTCGPSWVFRFTIGSYMNMLHWTPGLYRTLYDTSSKPKVSTLSKNFVKHSLYKYLGPGLSRLIDDKKPKVVICTHPFPLGVLSVLKEEGCLNAKTAGVLTDFSVHPFWTYSNCDRYYVAAEEMINELVELGEERSKASVTGIPIHEDFSFAGSLSRVEAEKIAKLSSASHRILIMGGSLGLGPLEVWVKRLFDQIKLSKLEEWQIVVIAGKNKSLEERLRKIGDSQLTVYGYTDKIAYIMAASDLLLTKPGGLSSSEAIALNLPQLLLSPLPGHEERNYQFLLEKGVARGASTLEELTTLTIELIKNKNELSYLQECAKRLNKVEAAHMVAEDIKRMVYPVSAMGS
ncbi:hypothetical protein F9B85_01325 [Heliorestis acidaminivorans]|uniref:Glycosyltransferase n=1 Tax=Heliorestis acidaminivorans TaxID=553427 RepID=A0A6I0EX22_9FIRM|nr:glycosyltransferase [Heliorestis acidaminivorans]KAB2954359.1 hypothetical protein F9B85_01325 [Heliorestis acidaminivorans]